MIFTRALVIAVTATGLVVALGPGGEGPGPAIVARELVRERALVADAALADLETALAPGLEAGRDGAARIVAGADPPGERLEAAAAALRAALPAASTVVRRIDELEAARRALGAAATGELSPPATPDDVGSIADQLDAAAPAADGFVEMRLRAERLTELLDGALDAMEAGDLDGARAAVDRALADHDALEAWEIGLLTLPVWLETTGAMLDAVDAMLVALEAGDADAADAAADRVAALAPEAATADRALRIAMGEGGASVPAAPLGRLAALLAELDAARARVASILQSVGR